MTLNQDLAAMIKRAKNSSPPWSDSGHWLALNQLMAAWAGSDRQTRAISHASDLVDCLRLADKLMDQLCAVACPWCPAPCCIDARVWLDQVDLAFIHLAGFEPPPAQLRDNLHQTCRYLGSRGCLLPRFIRPWVCTWHLCPTLKRRLARVPSQFDQWSSLEASIKKLRTQLAGTLPR